MIRLILYLNILTTIYFATAQIVAYYPNVLEEGKEAVISCYEASKPIGGAFWDYGDDNTPYTNLCRVISNDSVLEQRDDCYGNTSDGIQANFTFTIKNVSWNRDVGENWKCRMPSNYVVLNVQNVTVSESVEYVEKPEGSVYRKEDTTITAKINCHYPVSNDNIFWCMQNDNKEIKCSDDGDQFYKDIFEDGVTMEITQPKNCSEYKGGLVKSFTTTFKGTTTRDWDTGSTYKLFVKVNGEYYKEGAVTVKLEHLTNGEVAAVATCSVAATGAAAGGLIYYVKRKKSSNKE